MQPSVFGPPTLAHANPTPQRTPLNQRARLRLVMLNDAQLFVWWLSLEATIKQLGDNWDIFSEPQQLITHIAKRLMWVYGIRMVDIPTFEAQTT